MRVKRGREWVSERVIILFRENSCVRLHVCKQRRIIELLVWKCWNEQSAWEGGSWTSSQIPPTRSHTITANHFDVYRSLTVSPLLLTTDFTWTDSKYSAHDKCLRCHGNKSEGHTHIVPSTWKWRSGTGTRSVEPFQCRRLGSWGNHRQSVSSDTPPLLLQRLVSLSIKYEMILWIFTQSSLPSLIFKTHKMF